MGAARSALLRIALAFGILGFLALPARAADNSLIDVTKSAKLAIPDPSVPSGYTARPIESYAITKASMLPLLGKHMTSLFVTQGWSSGYHGWLDEVDRRNSAFVTYDFYGFKSAEGAAMATARFVGIVSGVQTVSASKGLPAGTEIFIDSTGTYGPSQQPFVAVEIVFRTHNVLTDITGYYSGADAAVTDIATASTIKASVDIATWLDAQVQVVPSHMLVLLPLIALVPAACRRRKSDL